MFSDPVCCGIQNEELQTTVQEPFAAQHSGQNAGLGQRTFPIKHQIGSWLCKAYAISQPTKPTQALIHLGSGNDMQLGVLVADANDRTCGERCGLLPT